MEKHNLILGKKLGPIICEAMGLDPSRVARIVLDINYRAVVTVYVERYGDERLLSIDWGSIAPVIKNEKASERDWPEG